MQAIQASQFEDLFEEQLRLYDGDQNMVTQEQHEQDQIAAQVREANGEFTRANRGDASTKEREKALQELENGYLKYKEIMSNIEVGRKFYNDLARIVGRFRDDCKAFVHQRRMEASQMEGCVSVHICGSLLIDGQGDLQRRSNGFSDYFSTSTAPARAASAADASCSTAMAAAAAATATAATATATATRTTTFPAAIGDRRATDGAAADASASRTATGPHARDVVAGDGDPVWRRGQQ